MGRPADDALHAAGAAGALAAHARSGHLQLKDDHVGVLHRPGTTPPWNWHLLWESAHVASVTSSLPHSPAAVPGPLGHWPNEGQPLRRTMIVLMAPADALPGPHHGPDLCQGCARRRAPAAGRLRRRTGAVRGRAARAGGIHRPAAALLVRPAVRAAALQAGARVLRQQVYCSQRVAPSRLQHAVQRAHSALQGVGRAWPQSDSWVGTRSNDWASSTDSDGFLYLSTPRCWRSCRRCGACSRCRRRAAWAPPPAPGAPAWARRAAARAYLVRGDDSDVAWPPPPAPAWARRAAARACSGAGR